MPLYFLQCEMRSSYDYQGLYDYLDELDAVQLLGSLWCFHQANTGAAGLRELFKRYVGPDDSLVLIEAYNWAVWNTMNSPNVYQRERDTSRSVKVAPQGNSS